MLGCPFCGHTDGYDDEIIEKEINYEWRGMSDWYYKRMWYMWKKV